jgi:hypothetical protein
MRYAKHKITGKIIATQSGDEDLQSFKDSGLGYDEADLEIGIATEAQIREWNEATVTDLEKCIIKRRSEYPSTSEFLEAYTEKEIGEDSTKWDAYIVKYNKVRNDNPKP